MSKLLASLAAALIFGALGVSAQDVPKSDDPPVPDGSRAEPKPVPSIADAPEGKFKPVTVNDLKLTDEARKKEIPLLVIVPDGEGKFPVILFSAAQAPASVGPLANFWASHGYVVIAPTHADTQNAGNNPAEGRGQNMAAMVDRLFERYDGDKDGKLSESEIPEAWKDRLKEADADKDGLLTKPEVRKALGIEEPPTEPKPAEPAPKPESKPEPKKEEEFSIVDDPVQPQPRQPRGQNRGGNRQTIEAAQERVKDFILLLDSLERLAEKSSALKGKIDKEKIAVAGIGFGAYTAGLLAGATVDVAEDKKAQSFADKRVKALLELSPTGTGQLGLTKESWKAVKLPMMTVTGSNDRRFGGRRGGEQEDNTAEWRREAFANAPEGGKVHVFIEGGAAFNFLGAGMGGQPRRGSEEQAEANKKVFNWVQASTLYFLNANLKADEAAGKNLDPETFKKATEGKVAVERK